MSGPARHIEENIGTLMTGKAVQEKSQTIAASKSATATSPPRPSIVIPGGVVGRRQKKKKRHTIATIKHLTPNTTPAFLYSRLQNPQNIDVEDKYLGGFASTVFVYTGWRDDHLLIVLTLGTNINLFYMASGPVFILTVALVLSK